MRILYDHQMFALQDFGGISRCFAELYKNLPKEVEAHISLRESDNVYIKQMNLNGIHPKRNGINHFICRRHFPGKWHLYAWYNKIKKQQVIPDENLNNSIQELNKGEYDIFHPTYFDDYFLPHLNGKPFVLTIHDMIPELYSQYSKYNDYQIVQKRKLAPLANAIIAVSENTKMDIIRILGVPEEKVHVVYHGASLSIPSKIRPHFQYPYILYIGDRRGYKNFFPFVKQVAPVLKRHKEIHVVCTGHPFTTEENRLFKEYGVSHLFTNYWAETDTDLYTLYNLAVCFVYPSEYEGFGIPILEAYQANCPVLLNQASCFPEIARDAAIYFNINSLNNDLSNKLELLFEMNKDERTTLLSKQRARLMDFSWVKSAEKLTQIYKSI